MVASSTLAVWVISALSMLIYTTGAREPLTHTLGIPLGTIEQIESGGNPLQIPATWRFQSDDTLVLVNDDRVDHWLGSLFVPAGGTREYNLQPVLGGALLCSLHPDGEITLDVDVRDFNWPLTMVPTLAFGPAVGLILAGVTTLTRAIARDDESNKKRNQSE